jgi:TM2 domain-containing membrane protein YozV
MSQRDLIQGTSVSESRKEGAMFCPKCGKEVPGNSAFCPSCSARLVEPVDVSSKSRLATALLAFFLGSFGAHRFYIGKTGSAVAMLALTILGWITVWFVVGIAFFVAVGIWALVDFIIALAGSMKDGQGKLIKNW